MRLKCEPSGPCVQLFEVLNTYVKNYELYLEYKAKFPLLSLPREEGRV